MVPAIATKITAMEAQGAANGFLLDHLPDRFLAIEPHFDSSARAWRLPVVIAYPFIGPIGEVGEISVNVSDEAIISHTPFDEMMSRARILYDQHREAIETAFSQARNS
ncbi:MAG: hypothetical protein SF097_10820 [Acidobacteriota bacterium]|nr:hypothetical protein [Acidobacteriota bacterium]